MTTFYFGYGSNLWQEQMKHRCPGSLYLGAARLPSFRWIINERGYANIVEIPDTSERHLADENDEDRPDWTNAVFGLVYSLTKEDEAYLDRSEGVPDAYTKEIMVTDYWPAGTVCTNPAVKKEMLVYIDRKRTDGHFRPSDEYVQRMNSGIKDALKEGVPTGYVKTVLREYILESSS